MRSQGKDVSRSLDPLALDLAGAAEAIRARQISSHGLTEWCLERIAALDPRLKAFFRVDADAALAAATRADRKRARGEALGPLHGVPLAHKDLFFRTGLVTRAGSLTRTRIAGHTASVLTRLDRAGAIDLGTLNMSEFAFHPWGANQILGPPVNPWQGTRIAGASSGGSAAALAARLAFGSLGSDSGGSIRFPAALCGIAGLLPTPGLISRYGVAITSPTLDRPGPMARTVRDVGLLLTVIAGRDVNDTDTRRCPVDGGRSSGRSLRNVRMAYPPAAFASVVPALRPPLSSAVDVFHSLNATLRPITLPSLEASNEYAATVFLFEAARTHATALRNHARKLTPAVRDRLRRGAEISETAYHQALGARSEASIRFIAAAFDDADALLLPAAPIVAPTLAAITRGAPELDADPGRFMRAINYLGLPALALGCGFTAGGLPVGMQLIGRPFSERMLLRIGQAFQRVTDFHTRRPPLS